MCWNNCRTMIMFFQPCPLSSLVWQLLFGPLPRGADNYMCGDMMLTLASLSLLGLGKWLSLRVPAWVHWRPLWEGHRRMCKLSVPEWRALSGWSEWFPMPVSSRLFWKSVPGGTQLLTHTLFSTYEMNASSTSLSCQILSARPIAQSPLCQHCCIFGFIVKFSCSTLLNGCCSTVILFKRECFVEAAPGYSSIHSSLLKPRLRTPPKSLFFSPPSTKCMCVCCFLAQPVWRMLWVLLCVV